MLANQINKETRDTERERERMRLKDDRTGGKEGRTLSAAVRN